MNMWISITVCLHCLIMHSLMLLMWTISRHSACNQAKQARYTVTAPSLPFPSLPCLRHRLVQPSQVPLPDRIASYSASMVHHECAQISHGALHTRLEAQCETVVKHLRDVSGGATLVARMDLFFKVDTQNK